MENDILQAKLQVIEAGKMLLETGLIARTWGNVSCRISEDEFVITPSGRSYEDLTPDEIVAVKIEDLSYEGDIKPSSEKGVHAAAYKLRPEVNFVIHTHQTNASIVSAMGNEIPVDSEIHAGIIGKTIPVAKYGLPGTKKLRKNVYESIENNPGSRAIIMEHHGAVCMGTGLNDAFNIASILEDACGVYIAKKESKSKDIKKPVCYTSVRNGEGFIISGDDGSSFEAMLDSPLDRAQFATASMHRDIFVAHPEINVILQSATPEILQAAAKCGGKLRPLLDDYAQIAGRNVKKFKGNKALGALKGRSAAIIKNGGILCLGTDMFEAKAVQMVVEKNCKTFLAGKNFKELHYINAFESALMRMVYVMKYSKQKDKKEA